MTDDELKKLRAETRIPWMHAIIDEALSRGAQLKALQESEAALDGHCNAHIAMLDEARAALSALESEAK